MSEVTQQDRNKANTLEFSWIGMNGLKSAYRTLAAMFYAQEREIDTLKTDLDASKRNVVSLSETLFNQFKEVVKLKTIVNQVDNFLSDNFIAAKDGDYTTALHQYISMEQQIERDPAVNGGRIYLDSDECEILNKLLAGYLVGPAGHKVLDKLKGNEPHEDSITL